MINKEITFDPVRVIDENGEMIGLITLNDALKRAKAAGMDLICINEAQKVCRIYDYGKFQYEQKKREKDHKPKKIVLKEIQLRVNISNNDMNTKAKQVQKFMEQGNRVKIGLYLSGREINNQEIANETFERFLSMIGEYAVEVPVSRSANNIVIQVKGVVTK